MSADVQEKRRRTAEELINQIEGCLTERLSRKPISDLHHPIPAIVPQMPRPSSSSSANSSVLSPISDATEKTKPDYSDLLPQMKNTPFQALTSGGRLSSHLNRSMSNHFDSDSSSIDEEEVGTHIRAANGIQSDAKWRLVPQIRARNAAIPMQGSERRVPLSANYLSSLDEDPYLSIPTPLTTSAFSKTRSAAFKSPLGDSTNGARSRRGISSDTMASDPISKKKIGGMLEKKTPHSRQNGNDSRIVVRGRSNKAPECLSERQLNGYRALQRRLEYDPQASVAKERLKHKNRENSNLSEESGKNTKCPTPISNGTDQSRESMKEKVVQKPLSADQKLQSKTAKRPNFRLTESAYARTPRSVNTRSDEPNKEIQKRSFTNSPSSMPRPERRRSVPRPPWQGSENTRHRRSVDVNGNGNMLNSTTSPFGRTGLERLGSNPRAAISDDANSRNPQFERMNGDAQKRSSSRSSRRKSKPGAPPPDDSRAKEYPDKSVETISHKLELLAERVVRLRKLVEADYSEQGYCSLGDDIYVDEEVGAMSKGRPTGMHPTVASSLRNIRLLEANVQEIFALLYKDEMEFWIPTGQEFKSNEERGSTISGTSPTATTTTASSLSSPSS